MTRLPYPTVPNLTYLRETGGGYYVTLWIDVGAAPANGGNVEKKEVGQLLDLLAEFYPRPAKERRGKNQTLAWTLALGPYDYGAVKAAVLVHVRENSFYPDVAELTAGLSGAKAPGDTRLSPSAIAAMDWMDRFLTKQEVNT